MSTMHGFMVLRVFVKILEGLAVVVLEVEGLLEEPWVAESWAVLVGLQRPLEGVNPAAPEAAQHAGLQAARPHRDPFWRTEVTHT